MSGPTLCLCGASSLEHRVQAPVIKQNIIPQWCLAVISAKVLFDGIENSCSCSDCRQVCRKTYRSHAHSGALQIDGLSIALSIDLWFTQRNAHRSGVVQRSWRTLLSPPLAVLPSFANTYRITSGFPCWYVQEWKTCQEEVLISARRASMVLFRLRRYFSSALALLSPRHGGLRPTIIDFAVTLEVLDFVGESFSLVNTVCAP